MRQCLSVAPAGNLVGRVPRAVDQPLGAVRRGRVLGERLDVHRVRFLRKYVIANWPSSRGRIREPDTRGPSTSPSRSTSTSVPSGLRYAESSLPSSAMSWVNGFWPVVGSAAQAASSSKARLFFMRASSSNAHASAAPRRSRYLRGNLPRPASGLAGDFTRGSPRDPRAFTRPGATVRHALAPAARPHRMLRSSRRTRSRSRAAST